jgi:uncharacterized membrane protein YbjE (DUF340 family)
VIKHILGALVLGAVVGYLNDHWGDVDVGNWVSNYVFNGSLLVLLFVMGLVFGLDRDSITKMRQKGLRILAVPLVIACGSILGGVVGGLILGISLTASAAVTAGYGWYTLAGPLVGQLFGAEWGMLGFTVNFLRELLTIVTVSLAAKVDKYGPVAFGGATSMDTTLPVIVRYCGSDVLITAFSSGFVLSLIAPFTIMAISSLV